MASTKKHSQRAKAVSKPKPAQTPIRAATPSNVPQPAQADSVPAEALRASEQRFRLMADAAPVLMWMSGTDKLFTWFNKPWLDFVGRPLEQELGNGWAENMHADDYDRCLKTYVTAFDARQPFRMEYRLKRHDGEYRWVLDNGIPLLGVGGEFTGYIGSCIDITERKRAEEALRESEERLRQMMENAHVGIAFGDSKGRIIQANRTMLELVGWSEDDLRAGRLNCRTLCRPEDLEQDRWAMTQLATGGRVGPAEKILIRSDSAKIPVLISAFRLDVNRDENVTFVVDLTPQKQAEEAIRDREARLHAILDTAADAIITMDQRGIIQSVNPATERMFGYAAAELIGQSVNMIMPSPYREAHDGYLAKYMQTGEKHIIGFSREVEAQRKDGSIFPADLAVSEIKHLGLFTGIHHDLTQRKELEREIVEAASLEQRRIGQDLHDSVAQELTALNLLVRDLGETIRAEPASALPLVQRMEQGLQRAQHELRAVLGGLLQVAVDSSGLMAALSDLADRTQQERKVNCTFHCSEPVSVADNLTATQLYLIAQEAVNNSVRHAQPKSVSISLNKATEGLDLRVQDDGMGMPAPSTDFAGLGLRIMRHRAAIIGAKLTIQPARPSGTVVSCKLPRDLV